MCSPMRFTRPGAATTPVSRFIRVHDNISTMKLLVALMVAAALAPAQTLLVLNKEGSLAIVDPRTKKILGTVRVGDQPHEVDVSADGKLAYVTNYGNGPNG